MGMRRTVIVLGLAGIGVAAAIIVGRRDEPVEITGAGSTPLIAAARLPLEEVTSVTLQRPGEPDLRFERDAGNRWAQVEPFHHPVEDYSIRQFMVQTLGLRVTDTIEQSELTDALSAESLGLSPPGATLRFESSAGSLTIKCGRRGIAGRAFVRLGTDPTVYVVGQNLHERVESDPMEWRDRRIFRNISGDVRRVTIFNGENATEVTRDGRRWTLTRPLNIAADEAACADLLSGLGKARSQGYIVDQPDELARFGLDPPAGHVEVETLEVSQQDGQIVRTPRLQRLLIGPNVGGSEDRFAMIDGGQSIFRITPTVLAALLKTPQQLADPTASTVNPPDVKSLLIRGPRGDLELQRDRDTWRASNFDDAEVAPTAVEQLLEQLTDLRAPEVQILDYPRDLEVATITMLGFDSVPLTTVRIARDPRTSKWAFENGDNVLRVFPPSMVVHLTPADFGLKE